MTLDTIIKNQGDQKLLNIFLGYIEFLKDQYEISLWEPQNKKKCTVQSKEEIDNQQPYLWLA